MPTDPPPPKNDSRRESDDEDECTTDPKLDLGPGTLGKLNLTSHAKLPRMYEDEAGIGEVTERNRTPSMAALAGAALPRSVHAWLTVKAGRTAGPHEITMVRTTVGRGNAADIFIKDPRLSRKHMTILYVGSEFRIRDEGSANGTFLNGSRVVEYALRDGDEVVVGSSTFEFHAESRAPSRVSRPTLEGSPSVTPPSSSQPSAPSPSSSQPSLPVPSSSQPSSSQPSPPAVPSSAPRRRVNLEWRFDGTGERPPSSIPESPRGERPVSSSAPPAAFDLELPPPPQDLARAEPSQPVYRPTLPSHAKVSIPASDASAPRARNDVSRRVQADKYLRLGETAEASGDIASAAGAYRIALTFMMESDPDYDKARSVVAKADAKAGEGYVLRAQGEERDQRWDEARNLWCRAAKLRPRDGLAHERAANAVLQCKGDVHEAERYAQAAIAMEPANGDFRCTLAKIYVSAGLTLKARREIEVGLAAAPRNANLQALQKVLAAKRG